MLDFLEDASGPQSPYLNPIENLWSILDRKAKERKPQNDEELFEAIKHEWYNIDKKILKNLVDSMHDRFELLFTYSHIEATQSPARLSRHEVASFEEITI
jgi:hypothetical protein